MQIDLIHCAEVETASQITLFDRGVRVPEAQYKENFHRIHDNLTRALRALTCYSRDDMGASSTSHTSAHVYTAGPSTSAAPHTASSGTATSSSCKSFIIAILINFVCFYSDALDSNGASSCKNGASDVWRLCSTNISPAGFDASCSVFSGLYSACVVDGCSCTRWSVRCAGQTWRLRQFVIAGGRRRRAKHHWPLPDV
jgi:hypothetical protein